MSGGPCGTAAHPAQAAIPPMAMAGALGVGSGIRPIAGADGVAATAMAAEAATAEGINTV